MNEERADAVAPQSRPPKAAEGSVIVGFISWESQGGVPAKLMESEASSGVVFSLAS